MEEMYVHKVQYYETDKMGIVHHSNYIRWFEEARIDFTEKMGMGYHEMEAAGILSPVLTVEASYLRMVHFGDTVTINTSIKEYNGIKLTVGYEVRDAYLECIVPDNLSEDERKQADTLLKAMYLTFTNLEEQYKEYITIIDMEV